jgi:hypothetical protein
VWRQPVRARREWSGHAPTLHVWFLRAETEWHRTGRRYVLWEDNKAFLTLIVFGLQEKTKVAGTQSTRDKRQDCRDWTLPGIQGLGRSSACTCVWWWAPKGFPPGVTRLYFPLAIEWEKLPVVQADYNQEHLLGKHVFLCFVFNKLPVLWPQFLWT